MFKHFVARCCVVLQSVAVAKCNIVFKHVSVFDEKSGDISAKKGAIIGAILHI